MSTVVIDVDWMNKVLRVLHDLGEKDAPARTLPSVSMCGSDEVIEAFVRAFRIIEQHDTNVWTSWHSLASRTADSLAEVAELDASLAADLA